MDAWLLIHQAEALPPAVIFASGAVSIAIVQCVVVVARRLLARHRAARTADYAIRDPRRLRADAERLREACDASTANLETGIARLKQRTLERVRELARVTGEVQDLRRELAEKSAVTAESERAKAALELAKEKHLLELRRQDDELRARAEALAAAQQTIALLRGMLEGSGRERPSTPSRAAR
jgi:chromosome segregation ATPase